MATVECGYCGESFHAARSSCPHCGSDDRTGWKEADEIEAASVELGGMDDDAYQEFLGRERLVPETSTGWSVPFLVGVLVLIAILAMLAWI